MTSDIQSPPATVFRAAGGLRLLTWPTLLTSGAGVEAAVTARSGGVSSGPYATLNLSLSVGDDPDCVLENRRRLAGALGASLDDFVFARQVHGAGVRVVGAADRGSGAFSLDDAIGSAGPAGPAGHGGSAGGADALVTTAPGVVLAILTADCVPIVLHDPVAGVLACVHAGWRGTVAGVTAAAVAALRDLGSRPSDLVAGLGPAIAADRYQVGPDVHQAVTRSFGPAASAFIRPDPATPDRWLLDLHSANRHALVDAGIPAPQIHTTTFPTGPTPPAPMHPVPTSTSNPTGPAAPVNPTDPVSPGDFFSDRAARPCGRLALVARLRAPGQNSMDVTT
jgi:YfiH family protein